VKSVESSPAIAPFYVWEPPDRSIRVLLRLSLIDAFNSWLEESSAAGEEVGGILLGSVEHRQDAGPVVRIESFEPVRIEHRRGPTYTLTEKEKDRFGSEITAAQRRTRLTAVGLVRSHIRRGLYLDIADAALFRRYFPDPAGVFLLLSAGPEPVGGFFWEAGDLQKQAPYARFPLDRQRLERTSEPLVTSGGVEPPRPVAPTRRALPVQITKREPRAPRRLELVRWSALLGAAAAILLTVALWHESRATSPPKPARIGLGLNVARQGDHLQLTWDSRSPLVVQASAGTLWIDDGIQHTRRDLNRAALLKGAATYEPISGDVNFALEVHDGPLSSRESIRSIQNDLAAASAAPSAASPVQPPPPQESLQTTLTTPAPAATAVESRVPERTPRRIARRVFAPPPAEPEQAATLPSNNVALAAPPAAIALAPPVIPPVATGIRAAPLPPPPPVLDIVGYKAVPESKFRLGIRGGAEEFVSPKALREVRPELPRFVAETLSGDQRVELRAEIDSGGRVTDVEPLTRGVNPWLTGAANTALRQWRFEPALSKGRPVASRVVVTFRFSGPANAAPSSQ
jgi:protein TonB